MIQEFTDQVKNENFTLVKRNQVPKDSTILQCVWKLRRKRDIITQKINKYKARLNVDGSRMKRGLNYEKLYAPVASYSSIRLLFIMISIHRWHTKTIDYVQAFPQSSAEKDLYLKVPTGFEVEGGTRDEYALKLHKNV